MSVNEADILQIRRYLNGELDARTMYELELRAQNDAQLMDVMLGMEAAPTDHQPQIDEINRLIKQRVAPERKRVVPMYTYWAAAASVLLALGIGAWWITRQPEQAALHASSITQIAPADKTMIDTALTIAKIPAPVDKRPQISEYQPIAKTRQTRTRQTAIPPLDSFMVADSGNGLIAVNQNKKLEEVVIRGYVKRSREQTTGASYVITGKEVQNNPVGNVEQLLQGKVAGLNIQNNTGAPGMRGSVNIRGLNIATDSAGYKTVTGSIIDSKTKEPLTGATISMPGRGLAQADVDGKFKVVVPDNITTLTASFVSYGTQSFKLDSNNDFKIALVPEGKVMSETVIRGYVSRKPAVTLDEKPASTPGCNENLRFRKLFFDYIITVQKHTIEHASKLSITVSDKKASKALKFIARYVPVSINTEVKNGRSYLYPATFEAEKAEWLKWYEANKCKNLK